MPADPIDFWLWSFTVATAVAGGALGLWGDSVQRKEARAGSPKGTGYRLVLWSYVLMSISIAAFAIRGFL